MPARHLDERDDSYRGTYWVPPSGITMPPVSPSGREAFRTERNRGDEKNETSFQESQRIYTQRLTTSPHLRATGPMSPTLFNTDRDTQHWLHEVGVRRSLNTNIPDVSNDINVNSLRAPRVQSRANPAPLTGGVTYCSKTLQDNWVEEQRDAGFASGTRAKAIFPSSQYDSEYTGTYRALTSQYQQKLEDMHRTARVPTAPRSPGAPPPRSHDNINYTRTGFGDSPIQDHTAPSLRGSYWVGTAPHRMYESLSVTQAKGESLEFQRRSLSVDPRAKILNPTHGVSADVRAAYTERLKASQTWTKSWNTVYKNDIGSRPPLTTTQ